MANQVIAVLDTEPFLECSIDEKDGITAEVGTDDYLEVEIDFIVIQGGGSDLPWYGGAYNVAPSAHNATVLATKNKAMSNDVTVEQIYAAAVSNPAGGNTYYIADENGG